MRLILILSRHRLVVGVSDVTLTPAAGCNGYAPGAVSRLDREKSSAEKRVAAEQAKMSDAKAEISTKNSENVALEGENRKMALDINKMRSVISVLERERERLKQQVGDEEHWCGRGCPGCTERAVVR